LSRSSYLKLSYGTPPPKLAQPLRN